MKKALLGLVLIALLLSACSASFPSKEKISAMTNEAATDLLSGETRQNILTHWGDPSSSFSGMYGDIYVYEDKCIGIYYEYYSDDDSSKVTDVVIWDKET